MNKYINNKGPEVDFDKCHLKNQAPACNTSLLTFLASSASGCLCSSCFMASSCQWKKNPKLSPSELQLCEIVLGPQNESEGDNVA